MSQIYDLIELEDKSPAYETCNTPMVQHNCHRVNANIDGICGESNSVVIMLSHVQCIRHQLLPLK